MTLRLRHELLQGPKTRRRQVVRNVG
jgi:hypothetical protein